jgi:thymidylate synthase (FAD)
MHSARLIGMTQPINPFQGNWSGKPPKTTQDLLAYCARVSNSANQENHATGPKLLRSLVRRKEWSPFEMVSVTMEITTTRDIARQILRHRSFSFQEFSQRYAEVDIDELVARPARGQHPTDRQQSVEIDNAGINEWWMRIQINTREHVQKAYAAALEMGIAKEIARTILPEGMTPSRLYMAGTLRSWIHYVQLRTTMGTQLEHRQVAADCWRILRDQFPSLSTLLDEMIET